MSELVDVAIPADAQKVAESLGLKVVHNVTSGTWVRRIPRDEAEVAVQCLRDWGIAARIVTREPPPAPNARRAAQRRQPKVQSIT
jgi:hypothetical protein